MGRSIKATYLERLYDGKPLYIDWIKSEKDGGPTRSDLAAVRELWASGRIRFCGINPVSLVATFESIHKNTSEE